MANQVDHKSIHAGFDFFPELLSQGELINAAIEMLTPFLPSILNDKQKKIKNVEKNLEGLVQQIATSYNQLPYHKFAHAVDVTHIMYIILQNYDGDLEEKHKFFLIFTCLCHDIDHFGIGNGILNKAPFKDSAFPKNVGRVVKGSKKRTVMEAYHIERSLILIDTHAFFKQSELRDGVKNELKVWLTSLILATDLANQDLFLGIARKNAGFHPFKEDKALSQIQPPPAITLLFIKISDMGNVFRPYECAYRWTQVVMTENAAGAIVQEKSKKMTKIPTPKKLLKLVIKEQKAALKEVKTKKIEEMNKRMGWFANEFVWPMVIVLKDLNPDLFKIFTEALLHSLTPAEKETELVEIIRKELN